MRSILSLGAAALLAVQTSAFKHTSPLLIWSSSPNEALRETSSEISSGVINADEVYQSMSHLGCDWESLIVVHVDELHNSHLPFRSLPLGSKPDLHLPYLIRPNRESLDSSIGDWAKICGAEVVDQLPQGGDGKKAVILDKQISEDLSALTLPSHPHLLILTGTSSTIPLPKRQERPFPSPISASSSSSSSIVLEPTGSATSSAEPSQTSGSGSGSGSGRNSTIPTTGPILDRVQILTTPLITCLLISFLVFLPIVMFGVSALVGIQVPPRMMEIGKGMVVSKEKKDK